MLTIKASARYTKPAGLLGTAVNTKWTCVVATPGQQRACVDSMLGHRCRHKLRVFEADPFKSQVSQAELQWSTEVRPRCA